MSDGGPVLYNWHGNIVSAETLRDERTRQLTPGLRQWFRQFAEFVRHQALGLHCDVCHEKIVHPAEAWRHWGECAGYKRPMDSGLVKTFVKMPDGLQWTIGKPPTEKIELRAGQMEWLRQFQDVGPQWALGLHCAKCDANLVGANGDEDRVFVVTCGCREFIGRNREWTPAATPRLH